MDPDFELKLRDAFAIEAEEHRQAMTSNLIDLEKAADPVRQMGIVETIFREVHSLKGAAHAVNRTDIASLCQAMESVFADWKRRGVRATAETYDVLGAALDFVGGLLRQTNAPTGARTPGALQEMARRIATLNQPGAGPAPAAATTPAQAPEAARSWANELSAPSPEPAAHAGETVRVPMAKMDGLLLQAEEMVGVKMITNQHLVELRDLGSSIEQWRKEWGKMWLPAHTSKAGPWSGEKLRELLEVNETRMDVLDRKLTELAKAAEHNQRIVGSMVDALLDEAKQLAMQPFARLLDLVSKQVRDLSREQEKQVDVAIHGQEIEIDKRILEEMKAPLIHLIRNAIDHGLEKPEVRRQRNKSPRGLLTVVVRQRSGNQVEITVSDDGEGIDVGRVKASAVKSEVIGAEEAEQLSEAAGLALIFQSGVSTSPILTEISGRGLGMAIVREKIEKLGGQISIETKPQAGTTFRILLPVTLATFKGILVRAGGQTFVLPTSSVEKIRRIKREDIKTVENRETISLGGQPMSLAWLADVLELPQLEQARETSLVEVLILGAGEQRMAFAVEAVLHEQEVLVKQLKKPLLRVRNIGGATVLASGLPVLILNTADLLISAVRMAAAGPPRRVSQSIPHEPAPPSRVLVADDSVTSRMLIKNILESAGYQVTTAIDGVDAFTTLRGGQFDLLVSDVEMPRMDGFELTAKIRGDQATSELPVVLVTALGSREHKERGVDVGANAYIVKSTFNQSNLLEVIKRLI